MLYSLVLPDRGSNPQSIALDASTLAINATDASTLAINATDASTLAINANDASTLAINANDAIPNFYFILCFFFNQNFLVSFNRLFEKKINPKQ